jgi:hypothetical protein
MQPTDENLPEMDLTGDATLAMFGYELGLQAASEPRMIHWLQGDEFEAARQRRLLQSPSATPAQAQAPPHSSLSCAIQDGRPAFL